MEVDNKLLEQVNSILDIGESLTLICLNIQCTVRQHQSEPSILIITDSTVFVVSRNQHKLLILCKVQWPFVSKIVMSAKSSFQIFDQASSFLIESPESSTIVSVICNFLNTILFPTELPEFQVDRSFIVQTEPINFPQLYRFNYLTIKANMSPPAKLLKKYKNEMQQSPHHTTSLDFASYPSASTFSELLFESITIGPSVTSLSIPSNPKQSNWRFIDKILRFNPKLSSLTFFDRIDSSFYPLAEGISNTIESVKFCDSQFQSDHAQILAKFLSNAKVSQFALSNACDSNFLSNLISVANMKQIQVLSLEAVKGIDTLVIFKNFKWLKKLIIANSEVDVSYFINSVSSSNLEKLKIIYGAAISPIKSDLVVPKTLRSITLSQIRWEQDTFTDAWTKFSRHQPNDYLKLDFSGSTPPDNVWSNYFELLPQIPKLPKIIKLKFESNPIKVQFVQFLKHLPNLNQLSIAGCLSQDNPALIESFSQFVSLSSTIKFLNISGNEYGVLRTSIVPLLNEMQKNHSLETLDVSNNCFGEHGLSALQDLLIVSKTIHNINISGNKIESAEALSTFFDAMEQRKLPLHFDFPKDDIKSMRRKKKIRTTMITRLKKAHEKIQAIESIEDDEKQDEMSFGSSPQDDSIEDLVNGNEWKLPYPEIPAPDNNASLQQFNNTYSLTALVQKFYTSQ